MNDKQVQRRLYACDDCGERRFIAWVELNRAAKPKCFRCGCTRLELVSEDAKQDRVRLNEQRPSRMGGSLQLSTTSNSRGRRHVVK